MGSTHNDTDWTNVGTIKAILRIRYRKTLK